MTSVRQASSLGPASQPRGTRNESGTLKAPIQESGAGGPAKVKVRTTVECRERRIVQGAASGPGQTRDREASLAQPSVLTA